MPLIAGPDVNPSLDFFVTLSLQVIPELTQNVTDPITHLTTVTQNAFADDLGVVYEGPKPYIVWSCPSHSTAQRRESGNIGSREGVPNMYVGSYRSSPYKGRSTRVGEQRQAYQAYCNIAKALKQPFDSGIVCPPQGFMVLYVHCEHHTDAMYIDTSAGAMIGVLIVVAVDEVYPLINVP